MPDDTLRPFVVRVLVVIGLVAFSLLLWRVSDVLLLVFGAALVAILLRALAEVIGRWSHLPPTAALAVAVALVLAVIVGGGWLFGAELAKQVDELLRRLPEAWNSVRERLQSNPWTARLLQGLQDGGADLGVIAAQVAKWTGAISAALVQLLLVAFGGLYLAGDPSRYRDGLLKLIPEGARERVAGVIDTSAHALRRWLVSQVIVMAVVGVLTGIGLWLVGLPAPLALALLAGLLEFIPYVGPIVAAVPGLLLAMTIGPEVVLYTLLVYVVVQQVESNAILPLVARQMLQLPPALAIFSVVALGLVFGPLGLIFAAPLTVLIVVAIGKLYVRETLGEPMRVPGEESRTRG